MLERLSNFRERNDEYLREIIAQRKDLAPWNYYTRGVLLSGHPIYLCSAEQLLEPLREGNEVYPFDRGDLPHLVKDGLNLFTNRPLPYSYRRYLAREANDWRQQLSFYSLEEVLRGLFNLQPWCPLRLNSEYYSATRPLPATAPFPGATKMHNPIPWYPYYTYQEEEDTGRAQLVLDPYRKPWYPIREQWIQDPEILLAIADYHDQAAGAGFRQIPRSLWPRLEALHLKDSQPLRVYRGINSFKIPPRRGDTFTLSAERAQSWTTSFCVAQNYATLWYAKGIVVSAILRPSDILIDSRYVATEQLRESVHLMRSMGNFSTPRPIVFLPAQVEILSKPGSYRVVVESISLQGLISTTYPA
jgi:hypothetical protein